MRPNSSGVVLEAVLTKMKKSPPFNELDRVGGVYRELTRLYETMGLTPEDCLNYWHDRDTAADPSLLEIADAARKLYPSGIPIRVDPWNLEIGDSPIFSDDRDENRGCWVSAWVWVYTGDD